MSRYRLLVGFRLTEVVLCGLLITLLIVLSLESCRAYIVNARMLEPHSQLQGARLSIAIDSAYTGDFLNAIDYEHEPNEYVSKLKVSPQGHLTAVFNHRDSSLYSQDNLNHKTLVLLRNSHNQGGYQFDSWRCPDNPSPNPFSIANSTAKATIEPRYIHFVCHGNFR